MSEATKACNLTEEEIEALIIRTGSKFGWPSANYSELMERMSYLHKRLKAFGEAPENPPAPLPQTAAEAPKGWGS